MTLVIAAEGKEFVVLGSDSRGIIGDFAKASLTIGSDKMKKLDLITKHVGVLMFGSAIEFGDGLLSGFKKGGGASSDGVSEVVEGLRKYCSRKWNDWFKNVHPQIRPNFGFVVAGLDLEGQSGRFIVPCIYSMISMWDFAPASHKDRPACMGVTLLANYILNKRYRKDMDVDELSTLIAYAISETASVDKRVGGPIKIAIIDHDGGRELPPDEVNRKIQSLP